MKKKRPAGTHRAARHSLRQQLAHFLAATPVLGRGVYLAPTATVLGSVTLGHHVSVWYGAVLRADLNGITVGHHTNIQDNAVLHVADAFACVVGNHVTVGHAALVHACTIGDETLVGMGAIVLDGAVVGRQCLIGAGAVVPPGTQIPDGSLVLGTPARVVRPLGARERAALKRQALKYVRTAAYYLKK